MSVSEERDAKKMKPTNQLVTTPNLLSFTRGILGPVAMSFIVTGTPAALAVALVLMITAEFTDFLDGIVARRFGLETEYGKVIDPVCDSIYCTCSLLPNNYCQSCTLICGTSNA